MYTRKPLMPAHHLKVGLIYEDTYNHNRGVQIVDITAHRLKDVRPTVSFIDSGREGKQEARSMTEHAFRTRFILHPSLIPPKRKEFE